MRREVFNKIRQIREMGITILPVEQEVATVFKLATRNYVLSSGKIIAQGKGDDLLAAVEPASSDGVFYQGKMASTKFFCRNILTNVFGRYAALKTEDLTALEIPEEAF